MRRELSSRRQTRACGSEESRRLLFNVQRAWVCPLLRVAVHSDFVDEDPDKVSDAKVRRMECEGN